MARIYKATGDVQLHDKAVLLMTEWGKTLAPSRPPYFADNPGASHYPFEKTVCGLVDMYHYAGEKDALALLEKIIDWGSANLNRSRHPATPDKPQGPIPEGIEWYTLSENFYRAYEFTGNSRYKEFGDLWHYPQYWGKFSGKGPHDIHALHAYSHVNTLSSAAMTYAITGDSEYLKTIVNAYDYFNQTQVYATGGYGPAEQLVATDGTFGKSLEEQPNTFETPCGSWAVFKLGRYLIEFTGEARFGDWIEKLIYNGIGAALPMADHKNPFFHDIWSKYNPGWNGATQIAARGKTFYYADYRLGGARKDYYYANWPCCSGTYIQDVADYHNLIYFHGADSLCVNLFVPSEVRWQFQGSEVTLIQETDYPESPVASFVIEVPEHITFDLKLRVPIWANGATVKVNGKVFPVSAAPGTWATIRREWSSRDRVEFTLPMQIRTVPIDPQHPDRVAFMYGPAVLVQGQKPVLKLSRNNIAKDMKAGDRPLEFIVQDSSMPVLSPFYKIGYGMPYTMYFDLA